MGSGVGLVAAGVAPFNDWFKPSKARSPEIDQYCSSTVSDHGAEYGRIPFQRKPVSEDHACLGTNSVTSQAQASHPYGSYVGTLDGASRPIHSSPERLRQNSASILNCVPEDGSAMEFEQEEGPMRTGSLSLDEDVEDDGWGIDEELGKQGLYRGSYPRILALYTLAPLTSVVVFTFLAFFPGVVYHTDSPSLYPYSPYLPFPIPELLTSLALWSLAYLLREPFTSLVTLPFQYISATFSTLCSTTLHTVLSILVHQAAIPLLLIPQCMLSLHPTWHDPVFGRIWWVALGWAAAESIVGVKQGYEGIALYRDVLVTVRRSVKLGVSSGHNCLRNLDVPHISGLGRSGDGSPYVITTTTSSGGISGTGYSSSSAIGLQTHSPGDDRYGHRTVQGDDENRPLLQRCHSRQKLQLEDALQVQVDRDLEQLIALKNREELEDAYGMPVIQIPIFISCLQRLNALILPLGTYLLLSAAYLRSTLASSPTSSDTSAICPPGLVSPLLFSKLLSSQKSNTHLIVTLPGVILIQVFIAILHTPLVLPRVGVHTVVYIGLLVALGTFFAGLGVWEALS